MNLIYAHLRIYIFTLRFDNYIIDNHITQMKETVILKINEKANKLILNAILQKFEKD